MKKPLQILLIVFSVSFFGTLAVLLAHGATPSEALLWFVMLGYGELGPGLSPVIAALCLAGAVVATFCIYLGLGCAAIYGVAWIARRAWTATEPR